MLGRFGYSGFLLLLSLAVRLLDYRVCPQLWRLPQPLLTTRNAAYHRSPRPIWSSLLPPRLSPPQHLPSRSYQNPLQLISPDNLAQADHREPPVKLQKNEESEISLRRTNHTNDAAGDPVTISRTELVHSDTDDRIDAFEQRKGFLRAPNITLRKQLLDTVLSTALSNHAAVNVKIPVRQIVSASVNREVFPTMLPHQTQPLPSLLGDIYCNPAVMPGGCSTVSDWGQAMGEPLLNLLLQSPLSALLRRLGDTANLIHAQLTRGVTPSLVDFLEREGTVQQLESKAMTLLQSVTLDRDNAVLPQLLSNLSSLLLFDALFSDVDSVQHTFKNMMRDKVKAAALCRLSNGRLPNCADEDSQSPSASAPMAASLPQRSHTLIGQTRFNDHVRVSGHSLGCALYSGCWTGDVEIDGSQFDGLFSLNDVDPETGFPIYVKPFLSSRFPKIHSLVLWRKPLQGPTTERFVSKTGIYSAITPNQPNFNDALFESTAPFAFRVGVADDDDDDEKRSNSDTSACSSSNTTKLFPMCLTEDARQWVLARRLTGSQSCSGRMYNSQVCQWSIPRVEFQVSL